MGNDNIHKNHRQRMRAKFNETGFKGWSDYEILEYMLYNVYRQGDTNPIAHRMLEYSADSIVSLMKNAQDFRMVSDLKDVGETAVLFLRSLKEFVDYYRRQELKFEPKKLVRDNFMEIINIAGFDPGKEDILMICTDALLNVLCVVNITEDSSHNQATTSAERIVKTATMNGAKYAMIVHNHPNGDSDISAEDISMTMHVDNLLRSVGVELIDHMVVCNNETISIKIDVIFANEKQYGEDDFEEWISFYE